MARTKFHLGYFTKFGGTSWPGDGNHWPDRTGKTWLGCAFDHQDARNDHPVLYMHMPLWFEDLALARLDGRFPLVGDKLIRVQSLILDDWGTHGLNDQQRLNLLEIFEDRYRRKSTLITAHLPVARRCERCQRPRVRCAAAQPSGATCGSGNVTNLSSGFRYCLGAGTMTPCY